jgi:hypothetical protein
VVSLGAVDDAHPGTLLPEFLCDALADAGGSAGDYDDLVFEHTATSIVVDFIITHVAGKGYIGWDALLHFLPDVV